MNLLNNLKEIMFEIFSSKPYWKERFEWDFNYHSSEVNHYLELLQNHQNFNDWFKNYLHDNICNYLQRQTINLQLISPHIDEDSLTRFEEKTQQLRNTFYQTICPRRGLKVV